MNHRNEGAKVNAEHSPKGPAANRGVFAQRSSLLRSRGTGAPASPASSSSVVVRSSATDSVGQVRASRAKGKHGKDAGRVNGSAIGSTEDAGRRRLAAARGGRGALDRERASAKVNHTTRSARTPFLRTGFFATLPDSFRGGGGSGASLDDGGRPRHAKHQSNDGGQQLLTPTRLDRTAHRGVLSRPDSSTIGTPCVLALLGPAPAGPALGVAGSPPGAVTATAKGMGESK
jgi:hypothetical protein